MKPTVDRSYVRIQNNANQTNLYTVRGDGSAESYTALFAGAGFRYAQLSGIPEGWGEGDKAPAGWGGWKTVLTALRVHSDVQPSSDLQLPMTVGTTLGTEDVLSKIHHMTMASQVRGSSDSCRCVLGRWPLVSIRLTIPSLPVCVSDEQPLVDPD